VEAKPNNALGVTAIGETGILFMVIAAQIRIAVGHMRGLHIHP
jgi:oxalate decarboxylase/phosphoglucose isomerase-like protein (cupin superfamily)